MVAEGEDTRHLLKQCIEGGRVDVLRSILSELNGKPEYHTIVDDPSVTEHGTLLHLACFMGCADSVRALLHAGVNPCVQNDSGKTAMQMSQAPQIKHAFVQELLQAVAMSNLMRVCQLLSAGVPINSVDSDTSQNTPLHWAASFGNIHVLKVLLEGGANWNNVNVKGDTPLHDAVSRGSVEVVTKLLQAGADSSLKNEKGLDCFALASKKPEILKCLSLDSVTKQIREDAIPNGDMTDTCSIASVDSLNNLIPLSSNQKSDRFLLRQPVVLEHWSELLWPQPQRMQINEGSVFHFKGNKIRVCFDPSSADNSSRMMQLWYLYNPLVNALDMTIEWTAWRDRPDTVDYVSQQPVVSCSIIPHLLRIPESYTINIQQYRIELFACDGAGLKMAISTFMQIIRAYTKHVKNGGSKEVVVNGNNDKIDSLQADKDVCVPCLSIGDHPDTALRCLFIDMSGCRVFSADTLTTIISRLAYCKANTLLVHFEVRPTDRFSLPYTAQDIFHLQQMCDQLEVLLIPSFDLNSDNVDLGNAALILSTFFKQFPPKRGPNGVCHLGPHLTACALRDRALLDIAHQFSNTIMLHFPMADNMPNTPIPSYCVPVINANLMVNDTFVHSLNAFNLPAGVCIRFDVQDVGYLCQAPETMVKNAILAAKLATKCPVYSVMVCDMSTGCEIVPQSLSYLSEMSVLGASWNRSCDMKQYAFLLPNIAAEHILGDSKMTPLFQQIVTMGYIEHEITRLSLNPNKSPQAPLSILVQLILNPDNLALERLTPVAFKKARLELTRCVNALNLAKKDLPYNYELALTVAEIQHTAELMILAAKLGQSLCVHGSNPLNVASTVNVGVANLPLTTRTDLANALLEMRSKFQHTWLSRNKPETLHNALKIFDNLFKTLLPPHMQDMGQQLL